MKGGTNMKKSLLCIVMVAAVVFSMFTFVFVSEADSPTYNIPLATSAPKVDGKTGDAAWKNALTIDLSPSAVRKNGGQSRMDGRQQRRFLLPLANKRLDHVVRIPRRNTPY